MILKRLQNCPFILIATFTILGICVGYFNTISLSHSIAIISIAMFLILLTRFLTMNSMVRRNFRTFSYALFFLSLGLVLFNLHQPKNNPNHYLNQIIKNDAKEQHLLKFEIIERLKPTESYDRYFAKLHAIDSLQTEGKILVKFKKTDFLETLLSGSIFYAYSDLLEIEKPLNPNQFDYAHYLSTKQVFHQIIIIHSNSFNLQRAGTSIHSLFDNIRNTINDKLKKFNFSRDQLSIINALFLGQRQDIDKELSLNYQKAGLIHILAVSGLHVGILFGLLILFLNPLLKLRYGRVLKLVISIAILWGFAALTGLSPSVVRAVTMFTIVGISMELKATTQIYNSIFLSAFLIMLLNPLIIFDVGFQLSYSAVLAIVTIQPTLQRVYRSKFKADKKLWVIFTVTIAAQIGILPISLYYFHQFPLVFFISNICILPFLGIILGFGIGVIILALLGLLPHWLAHTFGSVIDMINTMAAKSASYDKLIITEIPFDLKMLVSSVLLTIALILLCHKKTFRSKLFALLSFFLVIISVTSFKSKIHNSSELIVFHQFKNSVLGLRDGNTLHLYYRDSLSQKSYDYLLKGFITDNNIKTVEHNSIKNIYQLKNKSIGIIDQNDIHLIMPKNLDILIISGSPKVNLDRILTDLHPKLVIFDGSNYPSIVEHWIKSSRTINVPYHYTSAGGAYAVTIE